MDRIDELKSLIENCKKTIESSEKEIEMLKSKESAFERVEKHCDYYYVDISAGQAVANFRPEFYGPFDDTNFKNNNYFLARERAKEVADKINFLLKLERLHDIYCPDYKPDWDDKSESKWVVVFDYDENKYASYWNAVTDKRTIVYFDSSETSDKVCEILNKELENA